MAIEIALYLVLNLGEQPNDREASATVLALIGRKTESARPQTSAYRVDIRVVASAGIRVTGAVTISLLLLCAVSLGLIRALGIV